MILLDLFSGIGGFHKGLLQAGFNFRKVYFSEIESRAIANYKYNYKDAEHIGAIESIFTRGIERPNIITFGSPCQDFSMAGLRKGLDGERSSLIEYALSAISHFQPDVFIWENVKGVFSSNAGEDFWAIIQAFTNLGDYQIEWQLFNTSWFLPQNRERIYLIGRIAGKCRREILPFTEIDRLHYKTKAIGQEVYENSLTLMKNSQHGLNGSFVKEKKVFQINETQEFGKQPRQQNRVYETEGISPALQSKMSSGTHKIISRAHGFYKGGESDICPTIRKKAFEHNSFVCSVLTPDRKNKRQNGRRMKNAGEPSFTLTSQDRHGVYNGNRIRKLTEIECERLQGFPDDWTKNGVYNETTKKITSGNRHSLLGNAVTVDVIEAIGRRILENTELKIK